MGCRPWSWANLRHATVYAAATQVSSSTLGGLACAGDVRQGHARGVDAGQNVPGVREKGVARRRQAEPTRTTLEQPDPQLVLEVVQLAAERRLGDVEAPRRTRDVALLGD